MALLLLLVAVVVLVVIVAAASWALWLLLSALVVGLVIGALGRLVVPGVQPIGLLATAVLGFLGSFVGGFIGRALHTGRIVTILIEVGVAAVLVAAWSARERRLVTRQRYPLGR